MRRNSAVFALVGLALLATPSGCGFFKAAAPIRLDSEAPEWARSREPAREVAPAPAVDPSSEHLVCNGSPALCDRPYDRVAYPTTHNSMSNDDDFWFRPNQLHGIPQQLDDGIRALMLDTHYSGGTPYLCHGFCGAGRKRLTEGLEEVGRFMASRPNEVVTIIFESHISAEDTAIAFADAGLDGLVLTHRAGTPWPTLREMVASGRRLVVFTDKEGGSPAWFHDVWQFAWETPYQFKSATEFTCRPNRGSAGNGLFILNHFLTNPLPSLDYAEVVNRNPVLHDRVHACEQESGRLPNFVTVDFYSVGDLFGVVDELNGVTTAANRPASRKDAQPTASATPGAAPTSSLAKGAMQGAL